MGKLLCRHEENCKKSWNVLWVLNLGIVSLSVTFGVKSCEYGWMENIQEAACSPSNGPVGLKKTSLSRREISWVQIPQYERYMLASQC